MKILKIFGAVVGIHLVAFMLIFANPGCSSISKPTAPMASTESAAPAPVITVPSTAQATETAAAPDPSISFDPNAPATTSPRYNPTRPNTPAASAVQIQPTTDVTPVSTYTVVNGDTLSGIALKNHITVKELSAANKLSSSTKLKLGQKLMIPSKPRTNGSPMAMAPKTAEVHPTVPAMEAAPKPSAGSVTHLVKSGETLGSIARKYQVKQGEIAVANNITNPALIKAGMTLVIPGWEPPRSASNFPPSAPADPSQAPSQDPEPKNSPPTEVPVIRIEEQPAAIPRNP